MERSAICAQCGKQFEVSAKLRERFPGWTPSRCPECHGKSGEGKPRGRGRQGPKGRLLTPEQVLDRHTDGPDSGVFTDGSADPNPGPGGWGAVWVVDGKVIDEECGHEPHTTNNRMELTAIMHGIALVPDGTAATVYTDSRLAVDTVTKWAAGWASNGWKRKTGPVSNLDLVRPLYETLQRRPEIDVRWIKAHAGSRWNEYADALAGTYRRDLS